MFAQPRPKKPLLVPSKKRKAAPSIEEISFDNTARADYLTGFHKRKQERIQKAQEIAAEKARKEKIELRKQIREERKKDIENHVRQVNALLREAQRAGHQGESSEDGSDNEWGGFADPPPALEPMSFEEEYIDEDKFTTVTIESVNVDRDGIHKPEADDSSDEEDEDMVQTNRETKASKEAAKPKDQQRPKKKKKKFRYESKLERRATERKHRAKKLAARS